MTASRSGAAIEDQLLRQDTRILTLTGVGGVGKTRLALSVAERVADHFVDGVQPVPLAAVSDPAQAVLAIAQAVGVHEQPGIPLQSTVATFLRQRSVVLVLDNCEHLLHAAPLIAELLSECPRLKVLATSRAPLRIYGERVFPVRPLRCPTEPSHDLEALSRCPSVQLLIERARDVIPDFTLTATNAPSLAQITVRLDGLPLAIELAAARLPLLPPAALLARLDRSMEVLVGGPRDRPPRQQALRDTIDWSYQLLCAAHQALFRQLGVFAGGWSIEAAQAVYHYPDGRDDPDVGTLDGLAALMDASLIRRDPTESEPRFRMLETIREFAVAQLAAVGEADATRARHASYFVELGEQAARTRRAALGAASVLLEASNPIVYPWDRVVRERWQSVAAACLGDHGRAAYAAGRAMPTLEAIAYALEAAPGRAETIASLPHE